jgi:hypothetical protein
LDTIYNKHLEKLNLTTLNLNFQGAFEELRDYYIELLGEIGFFIIHQEEWGDGFRVIGINAKRSSQLTATIMNLFIGYIHKNRIAIELVAHRENNHLAAFLICTSYLDVVDLVAPDEKPEEKERCERLANMFYDRIQGKFGKNP